MKVIEQLKMHRYWTRLRFLTCLIGTLIYFMRLAVLICVVKLNKNTPNEAENQTKQEPL